MKIALVVPGGVDRSGEVRVVPALLALIKRLAARHELHVYALRQEAGPGDWPLLGAQVHNIGGYSRLSPWRCVAAIRAEHRKRAFDAVQAIWSGHGGFAAVLAARSLGLPCAVHLAGGELVALASIGYGGRLDWRGRLREALVLRGANRLTAASAPMLDQLAALGHRAQRLPLGVDLDTWPLRAPEARDDPQAPLRLIHVASINRVKDPSTLMYAMAMLARMGTDFHLDLVGEDTLNGQIQALAQRLGLSGQVRFHGFQTRSETWQLMAQAHVHLVSSLHEAGPLALLEAAVAGLPSVGTRVGHLAEWAGDAALAVEVGDAQGLALAVQQLGRDEGLRLKLAHEAQRRAVREDADHSAALMEAMWAGLSASWGGG